MAGEWRLHQVSALIERGALVVGDGYRAKNEELSRRGLPFARAGNINDGFRFDDADHFPEENIERVGNKVSQPGDVVFTSKGTVGRFGFVRPATPRFVYSPQLCFWRSLDPQLIDPRFLFFWMFGREFFVQFRGVAGQTDMAEYVSLTDQRCMHITLPPLSEQRAIARILGTLDDKIELNRRTNETLEAMAWALFKSWFVDFDPVRAKTEGRAPGLPKEIADLFPDRFEDFELGEIPAGWTIEAVGDVAERVAMGPFGSSIKVETFVPKGVPIISGQHLHGLMLEDSTFNFISGEHAEKLANAMVKRGDVVFTHAGNIGQVAFIPENSRYEHYVISQRQFYMRCHLSQVTPTFVALHFKSPDGQHQLLANTSSSGVPSIARPVTYLRSIRLPIPPRAVLSAFEGFVQPVLVKVRQSQDESRTLAALRDTLLPKLISGELWVKDAEQFAGGVGSMDEVARGRA
ncbi:MAG: restriction endonuclease subunit S [Candidatus Binatia bacterium]|jgi:type I restriction enzyme, S subunit